MSVYSVELEWYNEDEDNVFRPTESFYFDRAEAALDFASNIVTDKYEYEKYHKPTDVYLYKIEEGQMINENTIYSFTAAWQGLDKKYWI